MANRARRWLPDDRVQQRNIRESRLQNHCVNQSNESRMNDCIGILYSDSEFMDLSGSLILAPPVLLLVP